MIDDKCGVPRELQAMKGMALGHAVNENVPKNRGNAVAEVAPPA